MARWMRVYCAIRCRGEGEVVRTWHYRKMDARRASKDGAAGFPGIVVQYEIPHSSEGVVDFLNKIEME